MKIPLLILATMIGIAVINAHTIIDPTFIESNFNKSEILIVTIPSNINLPEDFVVGVEFELSVSGKIIVTYVSGDTELAGLVKNSIENINIEKLNVPIGEKFNYDLIFRKIA